MAFCCVSDGTEHQDAACAFSADIVAEEASLCFAFRAWQFWLFTSTWVPRFISSQQAQADLELKMVVVVVGGILHAQTKPAHGGGEWLNNQ